MTCSRLVVFFSYFDITEILLKVALNTISLTVIIFWYSDASIDKADCHNILVIKISLKMMLNMKCC